MVKQDKVSVKVPSSVPRLNGYTSNGHFLSTKTKLFLHPVPLETPPCLRKQCQVQNLLN